MDPPGPRFFSDGVAHWRVSLPITRFWDHLFFVVWTRTLESLHSVLSLCPDARLNVSKLQWMSITVCGWGTIHEPSISAKSYPCREPLIPAKFWRFGNTEQQSCVIWSLKNKFKSHWTGQFMTSKFHTSFFLLSKAVMSLRVFVFVFFNFKKS